MHYHLNTEVSISVPFQDLIHLVEQSLFVKTVYVLIAMLLCYPLFRQCFSYYGAVMFRKPWIIFLVFRCSQLTLTLYHLDERFVTQGITLNDKSFTSVETKNQRILLIQECFYLQTSNFCCRCSLLRLFEYRVEDQFTTLFNINIYVVLDKLVQISTQRCLFVNLY